MFFTRLALAMLAGAVLFVFLAWLMLLWARQ